ncbi:MAG: D-sedoheptulose 7-phosphate isomerase [Saprospiraceae bacterium]|nr:D-sedoheptulose 7-phosphate isomerase [Saprospiraceae bacterium]
MQNKIQSIIQESIRVKQALLQDDQLCQVVGHVVDAWVNALKNGRKVLFCGNGGSAADAQHLAAELSGRFYFDRDPLPAEALHVNTSYLTAVANDYSYEEIYGRLVKGMGHEGDILIALSTSGNSPNILRAVEEARKKKMIIIGMTGASGGKLNDQCDYMLKVPSSDTPRVQESHILLGHILCELTEAQLFARP